jgi:hypothetical protein
MYEKFRSSLAADGPASAPGAADLRFFEGVKDAQLKELLKRFAGTTFGGGLYRVATPKQMRGATDFIKTAHPGAAGKTLGFGYDWMGNIFAIDVSRRARAGFAVRLFLPGSGEILETEADVLTLHEHEFAEDREGSLSEILFKSWLETAGAAPGPDQCVGFKKPLFLGGEETIANLELCDLDVYWTLTAQMLDRIRGLPPGTRIRKVRMG